MQKTESSSSTTTTLQRSSKGIPGIPATRPSKGIPDIHDIPAYPGNSTSSSISRESTPFQHSPIRMHILQTILQFDWFPKKLHRVPVGQYKLQTLHSSKKGRCCDIGQFGILQNRITGQSDK